MSTSRPVRWAFNCRKWVPNREEFLRAMQLVEDEEKKRILRFVFKNDSKSALIGRLMLRKAVAEMTEIDYEEIDFKRSEKGRPIITQHLKQPFDFNISHHGDYCVLAADFIDKIGIDLTSYKIPRLNRDLDSYFDLMERIFTDKEWNFIRDPRLKPGEQYRRFMRLWCLKESFTKAEGIGIGFELRRINFTCPTEEITSEFLVCDTLIEVDGKNLPRWIFEEIQIDENHGVSVAYEADESVRAKSTNNFVHLDFENLLAFSVPFNSSCEEEWTEFNKKENKKEDN